MDYSALDLHGLLCYKNGLNLVFQVPLLPEFRKIVISVRSELTTFSDLPDRQSAITAVFSGRRDGNQE